MRVRNFSKTGDGIDIPDLAEMQIAGYRDFLQPDCLPQEREAVGLEGTLRELFPILGPGDVLRMEYIGYELGAPLRLESECRDLGLTYASPLRLRLRVVGPESVEEDVYIADVPIMLTSGGFVINGSERVIVAQVQRSPGVDFGEVQEDASSSAQSCRFVPARGTWVEFFVSRGATLQVRLGQSGRMPATWLLRAMLPEGGSDADLLSLFYEVEKIVLKEGDGLIEHRYLAGDILNSETGEIIASAGTEISHELCGEILASGMKDVVLLKNVDDPLLLNTIVADPCKGRDEALMRIYARFRPGEPGSAERAEQFFAQRFGNPKFYSLGKVGRFRINRKFKQDVPSDRMTLCPEDILNGIRYLVGLRAGKGVADDIDDLGNRVLRPIGTLLNESLRVALSRWVHGIKEKLVLNEGQVPSPRDVASTRVVVTAIADFFGRSELSQVADQTNPLAALNHIRRISALGPGGLNRKRAGFEVRDVHASHYGRVCPIETPEGPNIGLIASLGIFAKVDEFGFITTPYRDSSGNTNGNGIRYLRSDEEDGLRLAPAMRVGEEDDIVVRYEHEFMRSPAKSADLMDVSPKQIVGVSASLIPFLEHNDANRALMGSNMQRQAVPLLQPEPPLVSTGMERHVAKGSGMMVLTREEGIVTEVDASHIKVGTDVYPLAKYRRLNESTCLNQRPLVKVGQHVSRDEAIADGAATSMGELSLGRNVLVAFMMWDGYNFEDAIIISDNLVKSDKYTSIHIEEFSVDLRETRLGREEFTQDIPHVSESALMNLDQDGVVRVGTKVSPGDILVGKVAPKSKTELTAEERLLREIFGKAGIDVTNESLCVPPGSFGVVVGVNHYRRKMHLGDAEREENRRLARETAIKDDAKIAEIFRNMIAELSALSEAHAVTYALISRETSVRELLRREQDYAFDVNLFAEESRKKAKAIFLRYRATLLERKACRDRTLRKLRNGDELPQGVLERITISLAVKRPLSAGDKMAGRHGNKGVIARVVPQEDMPFLADGTPIEILLNPLGVPSRMNVGQILETHLGWAGRMLGFQAVTPVFDGATEAEVRGCLVEAGLPEDGKTVLYDGRTGEAFDQKVTVGYIYMMKLNHLVDDKIHARAIGPYSLITQQPLGGKARKGGQRLGEMEVWAIEAYGAAHVLQEMMTVKSDDVEGRGRMYETIIKGRNVLEAGTPISLNVLMHEMRGLGLNLQLAKTLAGERPMAGQGKVQSRDESVVYAAERR